MTPETLVREILRLSGGKENIVSALNCMTRLRLSLRDPERADLEAIGKLEGVLGIQGGDTLQIVLGPGKAQKAGDAMRALLKEADNEAPESEKIPESEKAPEEKPLPGKEKKGNFRSLLPRLSGIFTPMIPAIVAAGLFTGLGSLCLSAGTKLLWFSQLMTLLGTGFFTLFPVFTGYFAAQSFGGTPVLGALLGALCLTPAACSLPNQGGGILGVLLGVFLLCEIEKFLKSHVPDCLNLLITPFVSVTLAAGIYVLGLMPFADWISGGLIYVLRLITDNSLLWVRILLGFLLSAFFLPMVMGGYHHLFVILYALELQQLGEISILPCFIMAGAGQIGASLAVSLKARASGNRKIPETVKKALPAALLGMGEPLIYGVTLPLKKPFVTAGLGAGIGGALCLGLKIRMGAWGTSGLAAIPLMKTPRMMLLFLGALAAAVFGGFLLTVLFLRKGAIKNA